MPDTQHLQRSLFDGTTLPAPAPNPTVCVGGCGLVTCPDSSVDTPAGVMCDRCFADLYSTCMDCGKLLRRDNWGECDDLVVDASDNHRCRDCYRAAFMLCNHCGRHCQRGAEDFPVDPEDSSKEFCQSCWGSLWFVCGECDETFSHQQSRCAPGGRGHICEGCFAVNYVSCVVCGNSILHEDICGWVEDPYCSGCSGRADVWKVQPWSGGTDLSFDRIGSERAFGVEIETAGCNNYRDLHGKTEWGCVYECSTPGREFVSPILRGDEGFDEVVKLCDYADSHEWYTDSSCGLHVHIDARDLSSEQLLRVAYAYRKTYRLWKKFVSRDRSSYSMCGTPQYSGADVRASEHFEDFAEARDRFEFVNWRAYLCHGSIEVRLYGASIDAEEICGWVSIHARFIDAVKDLSYDDIDEMFGTSAESCWRGLVGIIDHVDLLLYWADIAARHGTNFVCQRVETQEVAA